MIIDPGVGDVLILFEAGSKLYGVGRVTAEGPQAFLEARPAIYVSDRDTAAALARAIVTPGRRIFVQGTDSGDPQWSEI